MVILAFQRPEAPLPHPPLAAVYADLGRGWESNQHQRARTARQLGITREGLYKKMRRHGIT